MLTVRSCIAEINNTIFAGQATTSQKTKNRQPKEPAPPLEIRSSGLTGQPPPMKALFINNKTLIKIK